MQKPRNIAVKEFLVNSPKKKPKGIFLLAHGAGKGAANPFLEIIAQRRNTFWRAGGEIQLSLYGRNVENREKETTE